MIEKQAYANGFHNAVILACTRNAGGISTPAAKDTKDDTGDYYDAYVNGMRDGLQAVRKMWRTSEEE